MTDKMVAQLAEAARMAPSCYNNQPWRFIFVKDPGALMELKATLPEGNAWANAASMMIAVASKQDFDCIVDERKPVAEIAFTDRYNAQQEK